MDGSGRLVLLLFIDSRILFTWMNQALLSFLKELLFYAILMDGWYVGLFSENFLLVRVL